ncbi:hypothetical protein GP486_003024 [Trichoglossum hirsutum]|uniref:Uncharacterized protein n=1 Tax=Trichoglossum hirsutum TaxID=265104 RepID=A0A9P8LDX4_9PEZI|nr:hypothetical protein GP486_003024 [Trichoglossum hirsutum]
MAELVDGSISKCTKQIDSLGEDIKEIKNLVRESAKYALMSSLIAAPPSESSALLDYASRKLWHWLLLPNQNHGSQTVEAYRL